MRFRPIRYLGWAKRWLDAEPPRFNLASSGMQPPSASEAGLDPPALLPLWGENAYGHPELRRRIGEGYGVGAERVIRTLGTSSANFYLQAALLGEGDVALCEWPAYEPVYRTLEALGARVEWVARPREAGYQPDVDAICRGFARGARLAVLTDLHNPTATLIDRGRLAAIARAAERHDAWVVLDEVYLSGVFDREVASAATLSERCVVTGSWTKTYGLGGLRMGWGVAPAAVVQRALEVQDHLCVQAPFVADAAALRVLERLPELRERARARRSVCLPLLRAFAEERGLAWTEPAGGFIAWVGLPEGLDAMALAEHARSRYDTQVTPGDFFGEPRFIRLGCGGPPDRVAEALRRLGCALDDLGGPAPGARDA